MRTLWKLGLSVTLTAALLAGLGLAAFAGCGTWLPPVPSTIGVSLDNVNWQLAPITVTAGDTVYFKVFTDATLENAASSDEDTDGYGAAVYEAAVWDWDLDDSTQVYDDNAISHVYDDAGQYLVTLTANDDDTGAIEFDDPVQFGYALVCVTDNPPQHVDKEVGDDSNDGLAWGPDHAKATIAGAMAEVVANTEIWVRGFTATEIAADPTNTKYAENVTMASGAQLFGGFAGNEIVRDARNWATNITIIDADGLSAVYFAQATSSSTIIDGFTITGGSYYFAGGIMCMSTASPTISHNTITGNYGEYMGGGVFTEFGSPKIMNNVIVGNTTDYQGGGIFCLDGSPTITNNTIADNIGVDGGGIFIGEDASATIANNIVVDNDGGIFLDTGGSATLVNNDVYGNGASNYSGLSAGATDISSNPSFVATGDYHIGLDSPCRNAGDNDAANSIVKDIDVQQRIDEDIVDIGADEIVIPDVIYVSDENGNDGNSGFSWGAAKATIGAALTIANSDDEVWVAEGTYNEEITLDSTVTLLGGFDGDETQASERNWRWNETIISGDNNGAVVTIPDGGFGVIDGFTITNGRSFWAGGIYCYGDCAPTISHNRIVDNGTAQAGGGIACIDGACPKILNNIIAGNSCYDGGAGIYAEDASPVIINNTITENSSSAVSGIAFWWCDNVVVVNNIIADNPMGIQVFSTDDLLQFAYNDVYGGRVLYDAYEPPSHGGNFSEEPGIEGGSYRLIPGSSCQDRGLTNAAAAAGIFFDIEGETRFNGRVDVGADERIPGFPY